MPTSIFSFFRFFEICSDSTKKALLRDNTRQSHRNCYLQKKQKNKKKKMIKKKHKKKTKSDAVKRHFPEKSKVFPRRMCELFQKVGRQIPASEEGPTLLKCGMDSLPKY